MSDDKQIPESESKFNYIEEKVMPKRRRRIKRVLFWLFNTIVLAAVFGLTARYIFIVSEPYFYKLLGLEEAGKGDITFPSITPALELPTKAVPSPAMTPAPTPVVDNKDDDREPGQIIERYISPTAEDYQKMHQELIKTANYSLDSIVTVTAIESGLDWFNESFEMENSTSGAIIAINKTNVLILTTYAEIKGASALKTVFYDGTAVYAGIYNYDQDFDIAILEVNVKDLDNEILEDLREASVDDSYSLTAGTPVIAVGNPNGNQGSVDIGIISRKSVSKSILDGRVDIYQTNLTYYSESGGFILNMKGEILGCITHTLMEDEDYPITTFVGIHRLQPIIDKLINKNDFVYLGIVVEDIPQDVLKEKGIDHGVFVSDIQSGSPAFLAGIQRGDIITAIGTYTISSVNTFVNCLSFIEPGTSVEIKVKRSSTKQVYKDIDLTAVISSKE